MKRLLACLLTICLVLGTFSPAYATGGIPVDSIQPGGETQTQSGAGAQTGSGDGTLTGAYGDAGQTDPAGTVTDPSFSDGSGPSGDLSGDPGTTGQGAGTVSGASGSQSSGSPSGDMESGDTATPSGPDSSVGQTGGLSGGQDGSPSAVETSSDTPGLGDAQSQGTENGEGAIGDEGIGSDEDPDDVSPIDESSESEESVTEISSEFGDIGRVDVIIDDVLIMGKDIKFTVELSNAHGYLNKKELTLQADAIRSTTEDSDVGEVEAAGAQQQEVIFDKLAAGTYTLKVSAPGFATYTQNIEVAMRGYEVKLMTGFMAGITYEEGAPHPGVLRIGDIVHDGVIDEQDRSALVDCVNHKMSSLGRQTAQPEDADYDLNGDGLINLNDLVYFSKGYDLSASTDTIGTVREFMSPNAIQTKAPETTKMSGNIEDLFTESDKVVELRPSNNSPISADNPVSLEFDFSIAGKEATTDGILLETGDDEITSATITVNYTDDSGQDKTVEVPVENVPVASISNPATIHYTLNAGDASDPAGNISTIGADQGGLSVTVEKDAHGNLQVDLGGQVAVKKVTLKIKGMKNNNNLAEISKVEFVNGMEDRIPEPAMDIPTGLRTEDGDAEIDVAWNPCTNVTGYEVVIWEEGKAQDVYMVTGTGLEITSYSAGADNKIENNHVYKIKVQSVNGSWRSGYCNAVEARPLAADKPGPPDNVTAKGSFRSINVSWKKMKSTTHYSLYYRKSSHTTSSFTRIDNIYENRYTLTGLSDLTKYEIYVTGHNQLGESKPSLHVEAQTTDDKVAQVYKYRLINTGEPGQKGNHITNATYTVRSGGSGEMIESPLDTAAGSAWGTVDKRSTSYYRRATWDEGGYNGLGDNGITYEFDKAYDIDTIAMDTALPHDSGGIFYVRIRWWDESGHSYENESQNISINVSERTDPEGRIFDYLRLSKKITAKKIQIGVGRYWVQPEEITISEVYFYEYDSILDDILALYQDDLHTVIKDTVKQEDIDKLRKRIDTVDPVSHEYHPDRDLLTREINTAEEIFKNKSLYPTVEVHTGITTNEKSKGYGGLNAWQPLGVTAAAGEKLMIFVGHNSKRSGENTNLQLIATQYHAESSNMSQVALGTLKIGGNEVTIPKIWDMSEPESGGALYIQYTGNNPNEKYAVRVSGGVQVPVLDLYKVEGNTQRVAKAQAYLTALQTYVNGMESKHNEVHAGSGNPNVDKAYVEYNCILGATDILLDTMMLSLPAKQVLEGLKKNSGSSSAQQLVNSMDAMEEMMHLFYQHKGLSANAESELDQISKQHLNIRYQRMFTGAFMYASGNHIGIEYPQTASLMGGTPIQATEGKYASGNYFGWGIAHEIGHCINQNAYAIAEITNNYFAVLAQATEQNKDVRFKYEDVYKKVTSNTTGPASNVFTQLGMYWQLHLAYDDGYNYKTYDSYEDQLNNLFFARVDTYARTPSKAPKAEGDAGIALVLTNDREQDLMRLACAAAQKNILDFFVRWGKVPNDDTKRYAAQFPEETRAIYYVNDEARDYRKLNAGTGSKLGTNGDVVAVADATKIELNGNKVTFTLASTGIPEADVLGYEIVRCTTSGGVVEREFAGFATGTTFTDVFSTLNNRVVTYEVTLIDKFLNRSAVKTMAPLKIEHQGDLDKSEWTVSSVNVSGESSNLKGTVEGTEDDPCAPAPLNHTQALADNDPSTVYTGTAGTEGKITIEFGRTYPVTGIKYSTSEVSGIYDVQVRDATGEDGWRTVIEGKTFAAGTNQVLYFGNDDGKYVSVYDADAVRLVSKIDGQTIRFAEIGVLGVTGDNVDFRRDDEGGAVIGKLSTDYVYDRDKNEKIPAGSLVFTGSYKGNPAYNVVILYDEKGNIVGGTSDDSLNAEQIILANVKEGEEIQDVYDGTWIYWIDPKYLTGFTYPTKVRAELYRVNNAHTNEGQRLVSDSYLVDVPSELPSISFSGDGQVSSSN